MEFEAKTSNPGYMAKIVKHGSELIFDFSHLKDKKNNHEFEDLVLEWTHKHNRVARNCSAFILRLPTGELKNFVPKLTTKKKSH